MAPSPTRLLFVCVENANRSQMAQAFARIHAAKLGLEVEALSAGSRPGGAVNPKAVAAMREVGYDLSTHRPKSLREIDHLDFDVVVTMGCGDACPAVKARRRVDWQIPDPKDLDPAAFRAVRDQISAKVRRLLQELPPST
jgi:protein-tyrosine-phosphatase